MRRVVITGLGIVSSLGNNKEEVTDSLYNGRTGIEYIPEYKELGFRSHVAGTVNIDTEQLIDRKLRRFMGDSAAYNYIAMQQAIEETARRREKQQEYNRRHGIEPRTIIKDVHNPLVQMSNLDYYKIGEPEAVEIAEDESIPLGRRIASLEKRMKEAAKALEFEEAAVLRDRLRELQEIQILRS